MGPGETLPPETLQPSIKPTWTYQSAPYLATGGIYSQKDLDALRERIMFPRKREAVIETVAQQFINGPRGSPSIYNAFNEDIPDQLSESA